MLFLCYPFPENKVFQIFYVVLHSVTKVCGFYDAFEVLGCYFYNRQKPGVALVLHNMLILFSEKLIFNPY